MGLADAAPAPWPPVLAEGLRTATQDDLDGLWHSELCTDLLATVRTCVLASSLLYVHRTTAAVARALPRFFASRQCTEFLPGFPVRVTPGEAVAPGAPTYVAFETTLGEADAFPRYLSPFAIFAQVDASVLARFPGRRLPAETVGLEVAGLGGGVSRTDTNGGALEELVPPTRMSAFDTEARRLLPRLLRMLRLHGGGFEGLFGVGGALMRDLGVLYACAYTAGIEPPQLQLVLHRDWDRGQAKITVAAFGHGRARRRRRGGGNPSATHGCLLGGTRGLGVFGLDGACAPYVEYSASQRAVLTNLSRTTRIATERALLAGFVGRSDAVAARERTSM